MNTSKIESKEASIPRISTTLGEWGSKLPTGVPTPEGRLAKGFEIRPFTFGVEKQISTAASKTRGVTLGRHVSNVLAALARNVGPFDFDSMKHQERILALSRMTIGDVMYMYVWARTQALGLELPMQIDCPRCEDRIRFTADLSDLDVTAIQSDVVVDLGWDFELSDPFEIRGATRRMLRLVPSKWGALDHEGLSQGQMFDDATRAFYVVRGSVDGVDGIDGQIILADNELDAMSKRDWEAMLLSMNDRMVGPQMIIEINCEQCRFNGTVSLDWSYDSFFKASSRPRVGKR